MSASQIPHLSSFRRADASRRKATDTSRNDAIRKSKDEIVQNTDNDAATSRLSAVDAGYLDDPFAKLLTTDSVQRRLPLMNRGTYARTVGIDRIVETFIASHSGRKQIISLGAGSDTRYFRLKRNHANLDLVYHELDFHANTKTKIQRLRSTDFSKIAYELCSINFSEYRFSDDALLSADYNIFPQDLRSLPEEIAEIKTQLPTLLISECCLIYLSPQEAEDVLTYFTKMFTNVPLAIAIYEPIRPHDSFGRTMVRNLISRGIQLQTLEKYAELSHQRQRLQDHQIESRAEDVNFIWEHWVDEAEKERVDSLEWMDEVEEFVLLVQHYCIAWGWRHWDDDIKWRALPAST